MAIVAGAIGLIAFVLGVVARPERRDVLRGVGEFGVALAASLLLFGYLVPVHQLLVIHSSWLQAIAAVRKRIIRVPTAVP